MARDDERLERSWRSRSSADLPDAPGILTALLLTPELGIHLRGLADELLVNDFPGATLERAEREMLAAAVSAANDCFYCMDSHGAFANALLERQRIDGAAHRSSTSSRSSPPKDLDDKMRALLHIARTVRGEPRDTDRRGCRRGAHGRRDRCGRPAARCSSRPRSRMYNRIVEGFRARTPERQVYRDRAAEIATNGYSDRRVTSIPG